MLCVSLLYAVLCVLGGCRAAVQLPPVMSKVPNQLIRYATGDTIHLPCEATGVPQPQYYWQKDGSRYNGPLSGVINWLDEGSFELPFAIALDEGEYQCFAYNQYGTSMTHKVKLVRSFLAVNPPLKVSIMYEGVIGLPLKLECETSFSVPAATFSWSKCEGADTNADCPLIMTDERIQIDDDGHLHFANLKMEDGGDEKLYRCDVHNDALSITIAGRSFSRINIPPGTPSLSRPVNWFVSGNDNPGNDNLVVALKGGVVNLKCIFSGNPTSQISWRRKGQAMPLGRFELHDYNYSLKLKDLEMEDEGVYACSATNDRGTSFEQITLIIDAVPEFPSQERMPMNMNVTEGDTAKFTCHADAKPDARVTWYINGEKLDDLNPGPRRKIVGGSKVLEIYDVCQDCAGTNGHVTDLMSVQCEARNKHGYAFADAYLNVLTVETTSTTTITKVPTTFTNMETTELFSNATIRTPFGSRTMGEGGMEEIIVVITNSVVFSLLAFITAIIITVLVCRRRHRKKELKQQPSNFKTAISSPPLPSVRYTQHEEEEEVYDLIDDTKLMSMDASQDPSTQPPYDYAILPDDRPTPPMARLGNDQYLTTHSVGTSPSQTRQTPSDEDQHGTVGYIDYDNSSPELDSSKPATDNYLTMLDAGQPTSGYLTPTDLGKSPELDSSKPATDHNLTMLDAGQRTSGYLTPTDLVKSPALDSSKPATDNYLAMLDAGQRTSGYLTPTDLSKSPELDSSKPATDHYLTMLDAGQRTSGYLTPTDLGKSEGCP